MPEATKTDFIMSNLILLRSTSSSEYMDFFALVLVPFFFRFDFDFSPLTVVRDEAETLVLSQLMVKLFAAFSFCFLVRLLAI